MRLPAEWESHAATWVAWPARYAIWPDYQATCRAYSHVIGSLAECEPIKLLVKPEHLSHAKKLCTHDNIEWISMEIDDSWVRDTLPTFLLNQYSLMAVNWRFNAWGEKFFPYDQDAILGQHVIEHLSVEAACYPDMVLEGGAINSNGQGILLTTKSCLLNSNRNPQLSQTEIEAQLKKYLALSQVVWLEQGLLEDHDTDGHVDNVACFIDHETVLLQAFEKKDPNYRGFQANHALLNDCAEVKTILSVNQPAPIFYQGKRLALSYLNFCFAKELVLLPSFGQKREDDAAKQFFIDIFPEKNIVQLPVLDIVVGGGGIHCITHEEPKV